MDLLATFSDTLLMTIKDILAVVALLLFFQLVVLRRPLPNWKKTTLGFADLFDRKAAISASLVVVGTPRSYVCPTNSSPASFPVSSELHTHSHSGITPSARNSRVQSRRLCRMRARLGTATRIRFALSRLAVQ